MAVGVLLALAASAGAARAMQGPPDWVEDLVRKMPAGSVTERVFLASHVSRTEAHEYLERLGLERFGLDEDSVRFLDARHLGLERLGLERLGLHDGAFLDPEISIRGSDAFHGVLEARADWAAYRLELNGKFASRQFTEVLGQAMTVTAVISSDGLRISDDRGGSRVEAYRRFPLDACDRGASGGDCADPSLFHATFDEAIDDHGTIVEVIRDGQGLPIGVRFGESLLLRYEFRPPLPAPAGNVRAGGGWREPSSWELIDLRSSEIVIDSVDAARVASGRPRLLWACGVSATFFASRVERRLPCRGGLGGPTHSCPSSRLRTSGASSMPVAAGAENTSSGWTTPRIASGSGSGSGKATGASSWRRRAVAKA